MALSRALGQAESPDTTTIGNLPLREYGDPEWINHRL